MNLFGRRRAPDPARPGTIYRSKPKLGRTRDLGSGPPYLDASGRRSAGPGSTGPGGSGGAPSNPVGSVYRDHGGDLDATGDYGQLLDDPGDDASRRPGAVGGSARNAPAYGATPASGVPYAGGASSPGRASSPGGANHPGGASYPGGANYPGGSSYPGGANYPGGADYPGGGSRSGGAASRGGASYPGGVPGAPRAGGYGGGPGGPGESGGRGSGFGPVLGAFLGRLARPRLSLIVLILVIVLVGYPLLLGYTAWHHLNRVDALAPAHAITNTAGSPGRTFLVVGSDSRADLTAAERKKLGTGAVAGQRTDTIMLLHVPAGGGPTVLISVPRDSYVPIPGHGMNKINAAYAFGGAPLLVRTLEATTGIRIDDYAETDLGGFANIVDALGGVVLCPKFDMDDKDAHINLKKGCQHMNGKTALGYARARHSDPRGDLGRVERQRETLTAIAKKMLSPTTLIQPWRAFPAAKAGGGALTVDQGTSPLGLAHFVLAMRSVAGGKGISLTVPVSNPNLRTPAGDSVEWNRTKALELFQDLKNGDTNAIRSIAASEK